MTDRKDDAPWPYDQREVYREFCLELTPEQRLRMLEDAMQFFGEARAAMERKRAAERALAPGLKQDE